MNILPFPAYFQWLRVDLLRHYTPPNVNPSYSWNHVNEMLRFGPLIKELRSHSGFNLTEFEVAVLLHNTDRSATLRQAMGITEATNADNFKIAWRKLLEIFLEQSLFTQAEKVRIINAVLQHSKKHDEPSDSALLTALRIADKVVRFGPLGMMGQVANNRGHLFYDSSRPFGYEDTVETSLTTVYHDHMRVLEWYGMLPSDEARGLIKGSWLRAQIISLRGLGEQIAFYTGATNTVEEDIRKALGRHYEDVAALTV